MSPLCLELESYLVMLETKPHFVMYKALTETYITKMQATCEQLKAIANSEAFSASNMCLVQRVIADLNQSGLALRDIGENHGFPDEFSADLPSSSQPILGPEKKLPHAAAVEMAAILKQLIWLINHFGERLKTTDFQQDQLELAHVIGVLLANRKLAYFKVRSLFWW